MAKLKKREIWFARNDITGKIYGPGFEDILACQSYIDTVLIKQSLFWNMAIAYDEEYNAEEAFDKWFKDSYPNRIDDFLFKMSARLQYSFRKIFIDGPKSRIRNNVIRCWNKQQKRYADGFDY